MVPYRRAGDGIAKQPFDPPVNLPHSELAAGLLEDRHDCVADRSSWQRALRPPLDTGVTMQNAAHEPRTIVAGVALAIGGLLFIIATH
jgi:hypothetical protein